MIKTTALKSFHPANHFTLSPQRGERAGVRGEKFFQAERFTE
jgi:hypothetical protein